MWCSLLVLFSHRVPISASFFAQRRGWERQDSRGLTNVLCLHPLVLLFLFVDIPAPVFSTVLYSSVPHYGDVCHINSITEDHVGHPNVYSCTYTLTHTRTHKSDKSDKVSGNLILNDVTLHIYGLKTNKHYHSRPISPHSMAVMYTGCIEAELWLQTWQM